MVLIVAYCLDFSPKVLTLNIINFTHKGFSNTFVRFDGLDHSNSPVFFALENPKIGFF